MIKLIASDLDGTLLQNDAQALTPRAIDLISKLCDAGIHFVSASGRQYDNQKRVFDPLKNRISFIAENGSYKDVPQLVNIWFQVLFHSPPGVLFTFPSQYYALSVTKEYLALRGGPRSFPQGFSCLVVLWILLGYFRLRIRGFHPLWPAFPGRSPVLHNPTSQSEPQDARILVWALSISLAATLEIEVSFSSSGYLDVSVPRVPHAWL